MDELHMRTNRWEYKRCNGHKGYFEYIWTVHCTGGNTSAEDVSGFNKLHFQYDKIVKLENPEYPVRYQASHNCRFDNSMYNSFISILVKN